ncbi:uncharacterized protein [Spinacia oleracea]|uniref:Endonuclease/exonuclease/phosphatase domain-containing protein n=1 Tax=Spinacia oleracea TaxID=3562 RepID=A0ABM3RHM6_SPIOL|nr:uncharacterized protein LOC130469704 [Spinacia oleracea]
MGINFGVWIAVCECRNTVWQLIGEILSNKNDKVVLLTDFNQVEYHNQKVGGSLNIPGKEDFMNWRNKWQLLEIPFHGLNYTWSNNRGENDCIYERLDRGYAREGWHNLYPEANIINLPILVSDHSPIILDTNSERRKKKRLCKIDSWCLSMEQPKGIIADAWRRHIEGSPMFRWSRKLQQVRYDLLKWCKNFQKDNNIIWDDIIENCDKSQKQIKMDEDMKQAKEIREDGLRSALIKLDYWRQRAKGKWVALGDSNTAFFFRCAKQRKTRNEIRLLQDNNGNWTSEPEVIKNSICDHFRNLFKVDEEGVPLVAFPDEIKRLIPKLSESKIRNLNYDISEGEFKQAIFQMGGLKAPRPDGIPAMFDKKEWDIVGKEVTQAVLPFFKTGYLLKEWNRTLITLIPKTDMVGPFQNAFVPKRYMGDNCLLAHEVMLYKEKEKGVRKICYSYS